MLDSGLSSSELYILYFNDFFCIDNLILIFYSFIIKIFSIKIIKNKRSNNGQIKKSAYYYSY